MKEKPSEEHMLRIARDVVCAVHMCMYECVWCVYVACVCGVCSICGACVRVAHRCDCTVRTCVQSVIAQSG